MKTLRSLVCPAVWRQKLPSLFSAGEEQNHRAPNPDENNNSNDDEDDGEIVHVTGSEAHHLLHACLNHLIVAHEYCSCSVICITPFLLYISPFFCCCCCISYFFLFSYLVH